MASVAACSSREAVSEEGSDLVVCQILSKHATSLSEKITEVNRLCHRRNKTVVPIAVTVAERCVLREFV